MGRAFRLLALGALFATTATPLIVAVGFMFPFIEPKAIWFRASVDVAFAAWLALCIYDTRWRLRESPILGVLMGVAVVVGTADFLAPAPLLALLSRPERMEGFICLVHVLAFVLVAAALLDRETLQRRFVVAHVGASVLVALIGWLSFVTHASAGRAYAQIYSTLGNPVFLGQYAALMVCLGVWLLPQTTRWSRRGCWTAVALNLSMVYLSQSRGAALGLAAAGVVAVFAVGDRRLRRYLLSGLGVAVGVLILAPALLPFLPRDSRRFTEISLSDPRFTIWGIAWEAFLRRPILGYGQDGMLVAGGYRFNIDRAHNLVLDWLIAAGVLGLAAWLWFLGTIGYGVARFAVGVERAALAAFLTAYVITDMFLFDTLPTYILLGSVAAIVAARGMQRRPAHFARGAALA